MRAKQNIFSSFSTIIIFVALMVVGACLVPQLSVQLEPSQSLPKLAVRYTWHNASAKVIEQEVTSKLEGAFNVVKGIKSSSSVSNKGSGAVYLTFKKGVDMDMARFEIATIIQRVYAALPSDVSYPLLSLNTGGEHQSPLLTYTLNGGASPYYIKQYAEENIVPSLSSTEGVNRVNVYGATPFEWEISYDVNLVAKLGISADEIAFAINSYCSKQDLGLSIVKNGNVVNNLRVSISTDLDEHMDWSKLPVKNIDNRIIWLTDIAEITNKERLPNSYYRINGLNTINLVIYPDGNVNSLKLANQLKNQINLLDQQLPATYSLILVNDDTSFIKKELMKIGYRTLFSIIILLVLVLLITRSRHYLWLIIISLIANLLIAVIFYYIFEIDIHLYSLAGITVSFGMLIDNSIIMIDHIRYNKNRSVFVALLAATLTTIGALSIIFFLKEQQRINLTDFAVVIIINLFVSLVIALFFIPALTEKIQLRKSPTRFLFKKKRRIFRWSLRYMRFILFAKWKKWIFIPLLVLGFGIPIHWLPDTLDGDNMGHRLYNSTLGTESFQQTIKPVVSKIIGGSLRLFTEHVFEESFYSDPQETKLYVNATMPEGCTVQQLNEVVLKMENYISKFDEIRQFETRVNNYHSSRITIRFKPEFESSVFPYTLKSELTHKAISLGGAEWSISGVGRGFSNRLNLGDEDNRIVIEGYNYDQLYTIAVGIKSRLLENSRIHSATIKGGQSYYSKVLNEYYVDFDKHYLGQNEISLQDCYRCIKENIYSRKLLPVFDGEKLQNLTLVSSKVNSFDVWELASMPIEIEDKQFKFSEFGAIEKRRTGNNIHKNNQQYILSISFSFIGPQRLCKDVKDREVEFTRDLLPMGFSVKNTKPYRWDKNDKKQYRLLLIIIGIIFLTCSVLLESLIQPLVIILLIPTSYIGVFLTFYIFDFNFDQGGFASFVLLSGIVVNAGLYIINEYNQLKKKNKHLNNLRLYIKSFHRKIVPILFTILSTILGLVPFVWMGQKEVFWFAFAIGAMGGLLFSILALLIYMPLFLKFKTN